METAGQASSINSVTPSGNLLSLPVAEEPGDNFFHMERSKGCTGVLVALLISILFWVLLLSCSKETSFECDCTTRITVKWAGRPETSRTFPVSCDSAKIGSFVIDQPNVRYTYKTECK